MPLGFIDTEPWAGWLLPVTESEDPLSLSRTLPLYLTAGPDGVVPTARVVLPTSL